MCQLPGVGGNSMAVSLLYKSAAALFPKGKKDVLYVFFSIRFESPFSGHRDRRMPPVCVVIHCILDPFD